MRFEVLTLMWLLHRHTHIYNFYSGEEKSMCQYKMIFVMEISKVKKPLHIHFYRKYEIRYSAVSICMSSLLQMRWSRLHANFIADYRRVLVNPRKVVGSTACMYGDTTTHVTFSCVYLCDNVIQCGNVIRWDRRILKMYECLSSGTRLLQNSVNTIFNRILLKFLYTFWYFYFIKCN